MVFVLLSNKSLNTILNIFTCRNNCQYFRETERFHCWEEHFRSALGFSHCFMSLEFPHENTALHWIFGYKTNQKTFKKLCWQNLNNSLEPENSLVHVRALAAALVELQVPKSCVVCCHFNELQIEMNSGVFMQDRIHVLPSASCCSLSTIKLLEERADSNLILMALKTWLQGLARGKWDLGKLSLDCCCNNLAGFMFSLYFPFAICVVLCH